MVEGEPELMDLESLLPVLVVSLALDASCSCFFSSLQNSDFLCHVGLQLERFCSLVFYPDLPFFALANKAVRHGCAAS